MIGRARKADAAADLPVTTVIGYLETGDGKVALAYARGFVERRFEARSRSFVSALRFGTGFLWEAQEGGRGRSHLPGVARLLREDPEARVWVPSGERSLEVVMRDGKPLALMLPSEQAEAARRLGVEAEASGRMRPFEAKGLLLFSAGCATFAAGAAALIAAALVWGGSGDAPPLSRPLAIDQVPHRQWERALAETEGGAYARKLEFSGGRWTVDTAMPGRPAPAPGREIGTPVAGAAGPDAGPGSGPAADAAVNAALPGARAQPVTAPPAQSRTGAKP